MLIGTSLGKCVKDILDGTAKEDEVLFIVTNTMCPTLDRLIDVIKEYYYYPPTRAYDMTAHSLVDATKVAQRLFESGKLHQPRCLIQDNPSRSSNAHSLKDTWYEIVPTPSSHNQSVVDAYSKYRMLATLAE
jgi:hypothetical protein